MELVLRCAVPDRPGSLARLAGVLGELGADIEAVDVVDVADGRALDDLVVVVKGPRHGQEVLERLQALDDVEVVHSAPSRGHPGDAVTRAAIALEALLAGAATAERGITALVGGAVRADAAELVDDPPAETRRRVVIPCGERWLVLTRDHAFTVTERHRAHALARTALLAASAGSAAVGG